MRLLRQWIDLIEHHAVATTAQDIQDGRCAQSA